MSSSDWQALLQQGRQAVQSRQGDAALQALQQACRLQPGSRDCRHWLGQAQRLCGQADQAESTFRLLLGEQPLDVDTALALAFLLREQGRVKELGTVLRQFASQPGATLQALLQVAGVLRDSNRFHDAIAVMQMVIERESRNAIHYLRLARLYQGTGQHDNALQAYRDTLRLDPDQGGAWLGLATLQQFNSTDQADWQWLLSIPPAGISAETAMCLAFARAKGFDDLKNYAEAWSHYLEGNRLRHRSQPWVRADWELRVSQALAMPIRQAAEKQRQGTPVFIVGMLRSGTTLLEQQLDRHPQVTARGELNFLAHAWKLWQLNPADPSLAQDLAGQVWQHMRQDGAEDGYYVDKNPLNFRFLPLLAEILPEARILHLRRDGRDSCLSCFMQLFQHPDSAFTNQLDDLVRFYRDYLTLMQHFAGLMPGQILTLSYQGLVSDQDVTLARVWKFLGLPDPATAPASHETGNDEQRPIRTASSWQARQGTHQRSLGRWENYYGFAPEFFDRIAALDKKFDSRQFGDQ